MTERLYYTNAYLTEFESVVTTCTAADGRFEVSLAQTAFYPTGGGQPHDLGTLGGLAVLDVIDREEAGIVHVVDAPLEVCVSVKGEIDWSRRFDHMQQHSGQHMLSAAFEAVGQARTESFHLGVVSCTIDLNRVVSPTEIEGAEDAANRIVWEDREVHVRFASADEAAAQALRKESGREGTLRLIEVQGFDLSACGGTHVARTGVVGIIAVTGWEKFKGGTRVEFMCGGRALRRLREWRDVFSATSRVLSVLPGGLAPAIERLQGENKTLSRTARDLQGQLAVYVASELVAAGDRASSGRLIVVTSIEGWDAQGLKAIASHAAAASGVCVAVFSAAVPALVVVARAAGVNLDASAVVKTLLERFGGKGGGKPEMAQGGGLTGDLGAMIAAARELLGDRLLTEPAKSHTVGRILKVEAPHLKTMERTIGDVTIIDVEGRIMFGDGEEDFRKAVSRVLESGRLRLVLNLANVPYVDSAGISEMVRTYVTLRKRGGQMRLLNIAGRVEDLLITTKLLTVFQKCESEEEAISSFGEAPTAS